MARLITHANDLKRADSLAVGDIIPGGDAAKGHKVTHVTETLDRMLGLVVRIHVQEVSLDEQYQHLYPEHVYTFRPYDQVWVEGN